MRWFWQPRTPEQRVERARRKLMSDPYRSRRERAALIGEIIDQRLKASAPRIRVEGAQDAAVDASFIKATALGSTIVPEALFEWFGVQGFIGHQFAAMLAQHWLIDKACTVPARDAVRNGWRVQLDGTKNDKGEEQKIIAKVDRRMRIKAKTLDFMRKGRIFGIRIAIFNVKTSNPDEYYANPFNPDAVTKGSYTGITLVDPYWCIPELTEVNLTDPASPDFYEPTWWTIRGKRYHRSHLVIFRTAELPDMLKPMYLWGGVPLPQQIMERVYAAERTANEVPQLVMTKRLTTWGTDLATILGNQEQFLQHMENYTQMRDNYGVKVMDTEDEVQQFDTTLTGLDDVLMSNYVLVAAVARMPATKLMSTAPKGLNATGEYDEAAYHEDLESAQENDLTPLIERHTLLVLRSEVEPTLGYAPGTLDPTIEWNELDAPTRKETAEANLIDAQRDVQLVTAGAIDGEDVRNRIRTSRDSGYMGISNVVPEPEPEEEPEEDPKNDGKAKV